MAEVRVTLPQLADLLRGRAAYRHTRNLVLVALPLSSAHRDARWLAETLGAEYLDFDCALLAQLAAEGWDELVTLERHGTLAVSRLAAREWLAQLGGRITTERPLIIGNLNLAVRYELDVAQALYDATERGLCVIAAGGRLRGQTLLIHGVLAQTSAASPAYELVTGPEPGAHPTPAVQDRLL
ncbi:MAG: hypothetical protein JW892_12525 [Anaerolineae bacterium]|nr:hypothetical protein [Anaerolineae bacterium]